MSTIPTRVSYDLLTPEQRGVEAIKALHRIARNAMQVLDELEADLSADHPEARGFELGRLETALEVLGIMRPQMTREQVLSAAQRRLDAS